MIEIENLKFVYPRSGFCLQVDQFEVAQGEKVAIVGPSGSGKTTLLNLIAGIHSGASGSIRVGDVSVDKLSDSERRNFRSSSIGMVFQQFELIDYLNVTENILLPFYVNSSNTLTASVREAAKAAAGSMGLGDKLDRNVQRLSQGEQQRVAICRALVNQPRWILADEPTGNLDPRNKTKILELLFDYGDQHSATLLVVTHDTAILKGFDRTIDFEDFRTELDSMAEETKPAGSEVGS